MTDSDKFGIERRGPLGVPEVYGALLQHPEIDVVTIVRQGSRLHVITVNVAGTTWSGAVTNRLDWRLYWTAARMIRAAMDQEVSDV